MFARLSACQPLQCPRALHRWLLALAFGLAGLLGSAAAQATVFHFDGRPIGGCTLTDKEYSCPAASAVNGNDEVIIASGYTLKINSSFSFGWNQSLVMRTGSRLVFAGSFSLADMNPNKLDVTGGSIEVGGTFYMGSSAQSMTADVSANAIQLGNAKVSINGNLNATGSVNISSGSRITGNISGTVITTSSSTTITGNVNAASKFTLGSGGMVVGSVTAPTFDMLSSNSTVNGDITATSAFTMGSGNNVVGNVKTGSFDMQASGSKVKGNVDASVKTTIASGNTVEGNLDTGDLLMRASNALVTGNARVNWATLEWAGRVSGLIYCKKGTAPGKCDCVTNNSGFAVNTADGPRCEAAAPQGVHHYLIAHDGQANSCAAEPVTVTACANAACSAPHFAGAAGVVLSPDGGAISFGSSGVAQATVSSIQAGSISLKLAEGTYKCANTATGSDSCTMAVSGQTVFQILAPHHRAGEVQSPTLQALKPSDNGKACVPAFKDRTEKLVFSCEHDQPSSGRDHLHLDKYGELSESKSAPLACSGMPAGATPATKQVDVSFDANGKGAVDIRYPDVGSLKLKASASREGLKIEGEGLFTVAPYRFALAATAPEAGFVAGKAFDLKLTALNKADGATRGFDVDLLGENTVVALAPCIVAPLRAGSVSPASAAAFQDGAATVAVSWSEVGSMGLQASLGNFLGSGIGSTGATAGCQSLGPFMPAFLQVERDVASPVRSFDYSGEPIHIVVSARNEQGGITKNFELATGHSKDVTLAAVVSKGGPGAWSATPTAIPAASFTEGKAAWSRAYVVGKNVMPATLVVRATGAGATSETKGEKLKTEVRLGRLRLGSRFGNHKAILSIPVTAEYWTGKSWLLNSADSHTEIPQAAFAFKGSAAGMKPQEKFASGPLKLAGGAAAFDLGLAEGGPGPVHIAINLRGGTQDDACVGDGTGTETVGTGVATTGAALPWLRPFTTGCKAAQARDPYGRATFGVYTPENRRIIHVREVFN